MRGAKWGKVANPCDEGESSGFFLESIDLPVNVPSLAMQNKLIDGKGIKCSMFLGEYEHHVDIKGRVAVPAKFRVPLKQGAVISKGMGTCLSVYMMSRWEEKSNELVAGMSSDELRDFERRIYPSASEVELDGQGRIVIPIKLRVYANITTEVTVAGVRDHFEIWDRATWKNYQERLDAEGSSIPF